MSSVAARPLDLRGRMGSWLDKTLGIPTVLDYTEQIVNQSDCKIALDIGCGVSSHLSRFRPGIKTIGIDVDPESIEESRRCNVHDDYILADVIKMSAEELGDLAAEKIGERKFDLVSAYGVIEHLPKSEGWKLLEKCEQLTSKYVIMETPNGFVEQGPEFGNEFQRHLSGWFPEEFQGVGYRVYGTCGTKYLRGYMGEARLPLPGTLVFDGLLMTRLVGSQRRPRHAFNIVAVKDVRGVPARYASRSGPDRR